MKNMMKSKLIKGLMLGIAISALYTGVASAKMVDDGTIASGGQTKLEVNILYEKQRVVDQVVFFDHADEIAEQGFSVNYTGVAEDYIEIGISPYSDKNAKIIYNLLENQNVKVVASDEAVLYTTQEASELAATSGLAQEPLTKEELAVTKGLAQDPIIDKNASSGMDPDTPVSSTDDAIAPDEEFTIQIESIEDGDILNQPEAQDSIATDLDEDTMEIQIQTTAYDSAIAETGMVDDRADQEKGLSTPVIILLIAGGAVVIGGAVIAGGAIIAANKKRNLN